MIMAINAVGIFICKKVKKRMACPLSRCVAGVRSVTRFVSVERCMSVYRLWRDLERKCAGIKHIRRMGSGCVGPLAR